MPLLRVALCRGLLLVLLLGLASTAADAQEPASRSTEPNLLLLEVRLDQALLSEGMTAYQIDDHIYLPLGELARLLSIAIQANPAQGTANGFVLREERNFSLNIETGSYSLGQRSESFDREMVLLQPDDIYVTTELLERWLPAGLKIDLSTLTLQVVPREQLPLQARLLRELRAKQLAQDAGQEAEYPRHPLPYRLFGIPFIDQTLGFDVRHRDGSTHLDATYTAFLTGDLLGMESSLFFSRRLNSPSPDPRFTLARHDPDAGLLGPLRARSIELGSITIPGISNIFPGSPLGNGIRLSNRPLTQPPSFDRHTLEGDLPPGWDVELYFNGALVGFELSNQEGRYRFEELPLIFGPNEFSLVFHGPLGQVRVERHVFLLEQALPRPGELHYSLAQQEDNRGRQRAAFQLDAGLGRYLAVNAGVSRLPVAGTEQQYANFGLRHLGRSFIGVGNLAWSDNGGRLGELGLRTRLGRMAINGSRSWLDDFTSEEFLPAGDPIIRRDRLRVDGVLPRLTRLSLSLVARRDHLKSGIDNTETNLRLSTFLYNTSISNTFRWEKLGRTETTRGLFQISRRVAGIGLASQINYRIDPEFTLNTLALTADKPLSGGYRLNLGVTRFLPSLDTRYNLSLNKSLGRYGWSARLSHTSSGETAVGLQLFVASARDPAQDKWLFDAQPTANTGAASIRVFLDRNQNGVMDEGDEGIKGAGFTVSGGSQPQRTNDDGTVFLRRLPIRRHVDIAIDTATLEDPQWTAQKKGLSLVPRPGRVAEIDIPVILTAEIDGTVYVKRKDTSRAVGDAVIELVNRDGKVIAQTRSAADGFYVLSGVAPGKYLLRVSPEQLNNLGLTHTGMHLVTISPEAEFVSGRDFVLVPLQ